MVIIFVKIINKYWQIEFRIITNSLSNMLITSLAAGYTGFKVSLQIGHLAKFSIQALHIVFPQDT